MSEIPTEPAWDLVGKDSSGAVKFWRQFGSPGEAELHLSGVEPDDPLEYEIIGTTRIVPDRTLPGPEQMKRLCLLMHHAFVTLRTLGYRKDPEAAVDFADAIHNLPKEMYEPENWDWNLLEAELGGFQKKHPGKAIFDYVGLIREIRQMRRG